MSSAPKDRTPQRVDRIVFDDATAFAVGAAARIAAALNEAMAQCGAASLVLAGGSTPETAYRALARRSIDWTSLDIFWGDERCVPPDHAASNYRMARKALLVPAAVPAERVHRISGEKSPGEAADEYEDILRQRFDGSWPCFDLVLLGIGADGHVASLFPDGEVLSGERWVIPVEHGPTKMNRVSLTTEALAAARQIFLLATGANKAEIVRRVVGDREPDLPATAIVDRAGRVTWLLDRLAAGGVV